MKLAEHIQEAIDIGKGSYCLLNYEQLPKNASAKRQIEALNRDRNWQEDHNTETTQSIDRLIQKIEESK
jgi:hypothetical protein